MSNHYYGVVYYNHDTEEEYRAHLISDNYFDAEKRGKKSKAPKGFDYWGTVYLIPVDLADKIGQRDEYNKVIKPDYPSDYPLFMENEVIEK